MGLGLVGKLTVMFGADMKGFNRSMKKAEKSLNKTARNFKRIGSSLTTNVTLPVLGLGAASVKLASDLEESMNKVRVSFGDSAKVIEDFSETTLMSFGIAKGSALEMAALFGDMGTSLGMGQSEAAEMSKNLVGLAGDLASFKNVSIDVAQTGLAGIFTGETESLKKLGIMTQEAVLKNSEYFLSLNKSWKELTQLEKIQIRYNEVLRQSNNAVGDFVNTQDSFANQFRILQESIKETGAELGKELIPLAKDLVGVATSITKKLNSLTEAQRKNLVQYSLIAAALGPLLLAFASLLNIIRSMIPFFVKFVTVLRNLTPQGRIIGAVVTGVGLLISKFKGKGSLEEAVEETEKQMNDLIVTVDKFGRVQKKITGFEGLGPTGFRFFNNAGTNSGNNNDGGGKKENKTILVGDYDKWLKGGNDNIQTMISNIEEFSKKSSEMWFEGGFQEGPEHIKNWKKGIDKVAQSYGLLGDIIRTSMTDSLESSENFFDSFIQGITSAIKKLLIQLGIMLAIDVLLGGKNLSKALVMTKLGEMGIQGLAEGGLVSGPTLAMVGEGGSTVSNPEVVAPLDKLRSMMGGSVQKIEVEGRLSGRDIFLSNSKTSNSRFRST